MIVCFVVVLSSGSNLILPVGYCISHICLIISRSISAANASDNSAVNSASASILWNTLKSCVPSDDH
jgi:hypothetical protein